MTYRARIALAALVASVLGGCGDRPDIYDAPIDGSVQSFGLTNAVALLDAPASRVLVLTPKADQTLERRFVPIGKGVVRAAPSPDQKRLFVLSAGDVVRRRDKNETASLSVIESGTSQQIALESQHSGLSIDREGRYVALYAAPTGAAQAAFVENPNEIVIVDLQAPGGPAVTPRTLRSFGGRPQRVSFTPVLGLPGGPRRLLVVETEQDVHLLDLDNVRAEPRRPEITMRLTSGSSSTAIKPAAFVVDDGDPAKNDDARIGIRAENDSSVFMFTLVPAPAGQPEEPGTVLNDFFPEPNQTDVGGIPGDIVFVRTDLGIRLAATVPTARKAVLVDPSTSITVDVPLSEPYAKLSLITNVVGGASGTDTALLYGSGGSRGVAFWSLGRSLDQNYRTVEVVSLGAAVAQVRDVPPPRPELKVLEAQGTSGFYVLNLASRTASPLTTLAQAAVHVAPDGQRLWAFQNGTSQLSVVTLNDLHPVAVPLDRPINAVFDTARADGGRSLVAIHGQSVSPGATVIDALDPDTIQSRSYYGLFLEGL